MPHNHDHPSKSGNAANIATDIPDIALFGADSGEPSSVEEALASDVWKKSMEAKIAQLKHLGTFKLMDLPPGWTAIDCKWVFK
ncbi:hypothetical protein DXG03_004660, partial [Asterophora parasitica]